MKIAGIKKLLLFSLLLCGIQACSLKTSRVETSPPEPVTPPPIDSEYRIESTEYETTGDGTWLSPSIQTQFPFDECAYYWNVRLERGEGFRLYLQVGFGEDDVSPWLYAGYWGTIKPYNGKRENPEFEYGVLKQDWLFLTRKAANIRFKVVDEGKVPLKTLPALGIIATDNTPTPELVAMYTDKEAETLDTTIVFDIPLRKQQDSRGNRMPERCQSAALASAMQYFGTSVSLEQIVCFTTDPEYKSFGIWPRTINAAYEHGFDAYLDRFRTWNHVRDTLMENKVILCSITMPREGDYIAPPYKSMGGHIVALNGITNDGRVIVTDSANLSKEDGYQLQWLREDFEKIWMKTKGGVGMVICPPPGAEKRFVQDIPPFPRPIPVNDKHILELKK